MADTVQVRGSGRRNNSKVVSLDRFRQGQSEVTTLLRDAGVDPAALKPGSVKLARYERRMKRLEKGFRVDNGDKDAALSKELTRNMLALTVGLIPIAEQNVREYKNERAIYGYQALLNQCRELANDLRASADINEQIGRIQGSVIAPTLATVLTQVVTALAQLKRDIAEGTTPKRAAKINAKVDNLARELGKYVTETTAATEQQLRDNLIGGK